MTPGQRRSHQSALTAGGSAQLDHSLQALAIPRKKTAHLASWSPAAAGWSRLVSSSDWLDGKSVMNSFMWPRIPLRHGRGVSINLHANRTKSSLPRLGFLKKAVLGCQCVNGSRGKIGSCRTTASASARWIKILCSRQNKSRTFGRAGSVQTVRPFHGLCPVALAGVGHRQECHINNGRSPTSHPDAFVDASDAFVETVRTVQGGSDER